jgi:hypothetical protein
VGKADKTEGEVLPEALEDRKRLLERVEALKLPPNFLDEIIDSLGGVGAVAEMTGRRGRMVRAYRSLVWIRRKDATVLWCCCGPSCGGDERWR